MLCTSESIRPLTSIVSYPERGEGGNNKYRGNCSPKLIEDLIGFFKPSEICDYMCGSGTTGAAAAKCGISSKLYDLHSGFDLMNSEIPDRPEFIFWHPPYWDIIKYSDVMYRASDVQNRYGYNPCQFDLSRIAEWDEFVKAMNYAMMKQFSALEKGGRIAVLMLCTGEASRSLIIIACRFGILPYIPSFHRRSGASGRGLKGVEGHGSG